MKDFFGTLIIVILAFLAGLLVFWWRKLIVVGVALVLLFSGCDSGTATDSGSSFNPNAPAASGECPVPTGSSTPDGISQSAVVQQGAVVPVQFFTTSEPLGCTDNSLSMKPYKGLSCSDLAGDLWTPSYTAAYNQATSESVDFLPCCVAVTRTKMNSKSVTSPIVGCDAIRDFSGTITGIPSGKYVLCSTSGTFLGWIIDASVN